MIHVLSPNLGNSGKLVKDCVVASRALMHDVLHVIESTFEGYAHVVVTARPPTVVLFDQYYYKQDVEALVDQIYKNAETRSQLHYPHCRSQRQPRNR
jgi:hypothetical protein